MNAVTAMSWAEPGSAGAVKAVSVISTGTVRIHPEHPYGTRTSLYWWLLTSRRWTPPRPVNIYWDQRGCGRWLRSADAARDLPIVMVQRDTGRIRLRAERYAELLTARASSSCGSSIPRTCPAR